jgi:hypothetical protein
MKELNLFDVAMSRLRLPVPMAKLHLIHGIAHALENESTAHQTWQALLRWIRNLKLESEVLEALSVAVLARGSSILNGADLRAAVNAPSILSDTFIAAALNTTISVKSWSAAHSGEAPFLYSNPALSEELVTGKIVPLIFKNRIERLEKHSGKPFLRQWTYEFERALIKNGDVYDQDFSYFSDGARANESGVFIGCRGHCARSAYLRALALSCAAWGMPVKVAETEAMFASPTDLSLLPMLPGKAPTWAARLHDSKPTNSHDAMTIVETVFSDIWSAERKVVLHLNVPLHHAELYRADIEVISCLSSDASADPENVYFLHHWLLDKVGIDRTEQMTLRLDTLDPSALFNTKTGGKLRPALLPIFQHFVGYLQTDLVGRMPYLSANSSSSVPLMAFPRSGGADLTLCGDHVGELYYWNWMWRPMHAKGLGSHGGIALLLREDAVKTLLAFDEMRLCRVFRLSVQTREKSYTEWDEQEFFGTVTPFAIKE